MKGDRFISITLTLIPNPIPNPNVVVDLRNKETLNSFSRVHAAVPFRNADSDPSN